MGKIGSAMSCECACSSEAPAASPWFLNSRMYLNRRSFFRSRMRSRNVQSTSSIRFGGSVARLAGHSFYWTKPVSYTHLTGGKSGGCASKAVELTSGDLRHVTESVSYTHLVLLFSPAFSFSRVPRFPEKNFAPGSTKSDDCQLCRPIALSLIHI